MTEIKIRYKFIKQIVSNLFISLGINSYPVDILDVCSHIENCKVVPYSEHMKKYNLTENEIIECFGSDEGCTLFNFDKKRYLIFYNDLNIHYKVAGRKRWTLAHELGHVLLNHHAINNRTAIFKNNLTDDEYKWMEAEANRFASLLLANPIILYKLNIKNNFDIMKICNLTEEASIYRYSDYLKWQNHKYINRDDLAIILQFNNFINKKYCINCGYGFVSDDAVYCPICGQKLKWGDGKMKYKDEIKIDENGKALACPRCGNEDIGEEDIYCKICGGYLYQECSGIIDYDINGKEYHVKEGCQVKLDSNARYCTQCGEKTTFYKLGYLKSWEEEKQEIESESCENEAATTINFDNWEAPF